jgi:hypothetical protein
MDRIWIKDNAFERARIKKLADGLSDAELNLPLSAGWTIAVALVHLAFWDRRAIIIIRNWKKDGVKALSAIDVDTVNDALVPISLAVPPRSAANLALAAAEEIDSELENSSADFIKAVEALGEPSRLYRSKHRKVHLDEIAQVLKTKGKNLTL